MSKKKSPGQITALEKMDDNILKPYHHVMSAKSNTVITMRIPEVLNYWFRIPEDKLNAIKDIMCTALSSIILFDDIQDDSQFRRNVPAAHCVFGVPLTINASVHALLLGLEKILHLGYPEAVNVYNTHMLNYMRGQGADIYWRENHICPTAEEYKQVAVYKLGSALGLSSGLMQLFSVNKIALDDFIPTFALYYMIRDDYCNITKPEALEEGSRTSEMQGMKATHFCEEITEGKFTWPVIHALKSKEGPAILNILKQRTRDIRTKKHCLSLMESAGSLEHTRVTLRNLEQDMKTQIKQIGENILLQNILDDLRNWDDI